MYKNLLFYERLMEAADTCGKSINCIERELGYPRNALYNYRNGTEPSATRLIEIAQYFGLSPEYLMGKVKSSSTSCPVNMFKQLPRPEKLKVLITAEDWARNQISK